MVKHLYQIYYRAGVFIFLTLSSTVIFLLAGTGYRNALAAVSGNGILDSAIGLSSGLLPAVSGTLVLTLCSVMLATPAGVIIGVFISEYSENWKKTFSIFLFRVLSGIPSIIYGLLGFVIILLLNALFNSHIRTGLLISIISIAFLILPYIVHATIVGLQSLPAERRITGLVLGGKKYQNIFRVLLPESSDAIISGIVLAIGRAAEDTAVIMLTGAAAYSGFPSSLTRPFEALPYFIYYHSAEKQDVFSMTQIFIAALLIITISSIFIHLSSFMQRRLSKKIRFR